MKTEGHFINHCEPLCGLGSFSYDCPVCGDPQQDLAAWWEQEKLHQGQNHVFKCEGCQAQLIISLDKEDFTFWVSPHRESAATMTALSKIYISLGHSQGYLMPKDAEILAMKRDEKGAFIVSLVDTDKPKVYRNLKVLPLKSVGSIYVDKVTASRIVGAFHNKEEGLNYVVLDQGETK